MSEEEFKQAQAEVYKYAKLFQGFYNHLLENEKVDEVILHDALAVFSFAALEHLGAITVFDGVPPNHGEMN